MPRKKTDTRELRRFAEEVVDDLAADVLLPPGERGDFVTSLVRQWLTYDGNASFFLGEDRQVALLLERTALGKIRVRTGTIVSRWIPLLYRHWKINPDDMPDILDQLNWSQSADVVNADGVALRLWVNPKEQKQGVEPVDPDGSRRRTASEPEDYQRMAANMLDGNLAADLEADELDQLVESVTKQWRRFDGWACIFLDVRRLVYLLVRPKGDGNYDQLGKRVNIDLVDHLAKFGVAAQDVPKALARLNLAESFEFEDEKGFRRRLSHDPKAQRFIIDPPVGRPQSSKPVTPPAVCPRCTAVLPPWREGEGRQTCRFCGHAVSFP
jgi:hypothetical protein